MNIFHHSFWVFEYLFIGLSVCCHPDTIIALDVLNSAACCLLSAACCLLTLRDRGEERGVDMTEPASGGSPRQQAIKAIDKSSIQKICCGQVIVDLCSAVKEVCAIIP